MTLNDGEERNPALGLDPPCSAMWAVRLVYQKSNRLLISILSGRNKILLCGILKRPYVCSCSQAHTDSNAYVMSWLLIPNLLSNIIPALSKVSGRADGNPGPANDKELDQGSYR